MFETYTIKGTIRLGTTFGIPVRLHYTWFIVVVLITVALAINLSGVYPPWQNIIIGIVASLLFFGSMYARALAQGSVTVGLRVPLKSIALYFFGGVPRISDRDTRPIPEILTALAGPIASFIIAGIFMAANNALASFETFRAAEVIRWLVYFNIMIAFFNLIPAFPMDGGRIFRTIIWLATDHYSRATRIAILTGRIIGYVLIAGGILWIIARIIISNTFSISPAVSIGPAVSFAGMFLVNATTNSRRQAMVRETLHGATARYMMTEDYTPIKQQFTVRAAREYIKNSGQNYFVVIEEGALLGIVTLRDVMIPRKLWDTSTIAEVMTPISNIKSANPNQPAADLLEQMEDYDMNQIPVLEEGRLLGVVSRYNVLNFLSTRAKLEK